MLALLLILAAEGPDEPTPQPEEVPEPASEAEEAPGPEAVHWSQVKVKKQVQPRYPEEVREEARKRKSEVPTIVTCKARIFIDEEGKPTEVRIESCPEAFHEATGTALMQWRFYPFKVDGQEAPAQFVLSIRYSLE